MVQMRPEPLMRSPVALSSDPLDDHIFTHPAFLRGVFLCCNIVFFNGLFLVIEINISELLRLKFSINPEQSHRLDILAYNKYNC